MQFQLSGRLCTCHEIDPTPPSARYGLALSICCVASSSLTHGLSGQSTKISVTVKGRGLTITELELELGQMSLKFNYS